MGDNLNLDEIAEQELLNEAKRGAARASVYGALGWQKCPLKPTNKIFLQNILLSTISAKRREQDSSTQKDDMRKKLTEFVVKHSGGAKNISLSEKNTVSEQRGEVGEDHNHEELSKSKRKSDDKVRSSSSKRHCKHSSSISVVNSQHSGIQKQGYHNKCNGSSKHSDRKLFTKK